MELASTFFGWMRAYHLVLCVRVRCNKVETYGIKIMGYEEFISNTLSALYENLLFSLATLSDVLQAVALGPAPSLKTAKISGYTVLVITRPNGPRALTSYSANIWNMAHTVV